MLRKRRRAATRRVPLVLTVVSGLFAVCVTCAVKAQTAPVTGIQRLDPRLFVLEGARVVLAPAKVVDEGRIVIRGARILAIGKDAEIPKGARVLDCRGLEIWPGFIEPWLASNQKRSQREAPPAEEHVHGHSHSDHHAHGLADDPSGFGGAHWNDRVHPEHSVLDEGLPDAPTRTAMRSLGFTVARVVPSAGILRGRACVTTLAADVPPPEEDAPKDHGVTILRGKDLQCAALERSRGRGKYPNSLMGVLALVRQTACDAQWYDAAQRAYAAAPTTTGRPFANAALAAFVPVVQGREAIGFEVTNDLDAMRVFRLADEFSLRLHLRGSGYEYRRARDFLRRSKDLALILPVLAPEQPRVHTRAEAHERSLQELLHDSRVRENPARLAAIGMRFSLSTSMLKKRAKFRAELERIVDAGLPEDQALASLTTIPAAQLGMSEQIGSLEVGKLANLLVCDGSPLRADSVILETWIEGRVHAVASRTKTGFAGRWKIAGAGLDGRVLEIAAEKALGRDQKASVPGRVREAKVRAGLLDAENKAVDGAVASARREGERLDLVLRADKLGLGEGLVRLRGELAEGTLRGSAQRSFDAARPWTAQRMPKKAEDKETKEPEKGADKLRLEQAIALPQGAYARARPPEQRDFVIRGATIWTSGPKGRLESADIYVKGGKIEALGEQLAVPDSVIVLDGKGKHVTPGLIDAHSHTAISGGVNESTQAVTSEVRIADVVNPYDIGIYRQLAGGLTAAHLLHGSANPIGGQSQTIRLKWGANADELLFPGAKPGIKFALGENVKQSNWGGDDKTRYPQSRLGVEQILRDRFSAAREYKARLAKGVDARGLPVRRDLELEALVEVLDGERDIHCHSYRQDEILMLLRIAEDFGFRIGVLQHVLEGYKVAQAIAKHGAFASTFSDWWAYKVEVMDAIPYNGAMMHEMGVLTTFNSDSRELARRMNGEAAKAVKYGDLDPSAALRFVTLNAAIQLGIDARVGSLERGKDADLAVWSASPMSTLARCEQTYIEGRRYFDLAEDLRMRARTAEEHERQCMRILAGDEQEADEHDKDDEKKEERR